jgi:Carboxypeptidase regulatory-like domain
MSNLNLRNFALELFPRCLPAILCVLFFGLTQMAQAQTTTFAQFFEQTGSQDFVFTNNTSSGTFNTVTGGSSIFFLYQNIPGLNAALVGPQSARMTVTSTTTAPSTLNTGTRSQPMNQTIVITIIRDTPAPVGNGCRCNLLTVTISPNNNTPVLSGSDNGSSATLSATTSPTSMDHNVTFTSSFISFSATTARNLGLSFSSVTPNFSNGAGNFLNSFTAAGSGTFASNPVPTAITTAAAFNLSGRVLSTDGRGVSKALVMITDGAGATRTTRTNNFGYYSFSEVLAGNSLVTVSSKETSYAPQFVSVFGETTGVDFAPQPE